MIGSLYDAKQNQYAFQPILLVTITQNDGTVLNLCTHDFTNDPNNNVIVPVAGTINAPRSYAVSGISVIQASSTGISTVILNNVEYLARITNQDIAATQAMSEDGIDITPTVTIRIADPDQEFFTNFELNSVYGFKGAQMTLTLMLVDMAGFTVDPSDPSVAIFAPSYSSDSLGVFLGQCNPATQDNDYELTIAATSKLNMKRILLPTIPVQKVCPWILPRRYTTTGTDSFGNLVMTTRDEWAGVQTVTTVSGTTTTNFPGAADPTSQFYYCGFDNGATRGNLNAFPTTLTLADWTDPTAPNWANGGAHHCQYTKQGCLALGMYTSDDQRRTTGGFGGFQYDLAANNLMDWSGKSFIEGVQMDGVNSRALAKYNDYVPLVYGTSWVQCVVMNTAGDPNSTRGEAVACAEEVGDIISVSVNDITCPPGVLRYTGNTTPQSATELAVLADYGVALDNPPYTDGATVGIAYVWDTTPIVVDLTAPAKLSTGDYVYIYDVGSLTIGDFFGALLGTNVSVVNSANGLWTIIVDQTNGAGLATRITLVGSAGNMTYTSGGVLTTNVAIAGNLLTQTLPTFRWTPINYGLRTGVPLGDAPFHSKGDPYGNYCAFEWVVPIAVAQSNVVPTVKALIDGPKLPVFTATLGTYDGTNSSLLQAYAKLGSPYNECPVWQILNVLIRSGWQYFQIDLLSFITAAKICMADVTYTDQFGTKQQHARFACSFMVNRRKPASDILRSLRMACGALLRPGANGLLQIVIKRDIGTQQPNPIKGSNYNNPINVNIPTQYLTGPAQGYLAYDFTEADILRNGARTTFKIHQNPIQQSPNKIQVSFQDKENAYQQDGLTIIDDYDYNNVGEVDTQLQMDGPNTYDHIQRICTTMLAEFHKGNPSAQSHGTMQFTFDTTYRAAHLNVGDIVRLTFAQRGINQQLCRITSINPSQNFEGLRITMQWHDDVWYSDAFGQGLIQDSGSLGANSVNRPPFSWQPWLEEPTAQDPLESPNPTTDWNFQVTQSYVLNADDSQSAVLNVSGVMPVNQFSSRIRKPIVPPQGSFSTTGGTFIGPQSYSLVFCGVDGSNSYTAPSQVVTINVSQPTQTASLTVNNIICDPNTQKVAVFAGPTQSTMTFQALFTPTSLAKFSATIYGMNVRTWSCPDVAVNSITMKAKRIIHSGVFGVAITGVSASTITVAGAGWTLNQWAGRQCTVISRVAADGGDPLPIWNFIVVANGSEDLIVNPDPTSETVAVAVGDALVMRFQAQITPIVPIDGTFNPTTGENTPTPLTSSSLVKITDPLLINSLNGFSPPFDVINVQNNGDGTSTVYTDGANNFDGTHLIYIEEVGGAVEVDGRWSSITIVSSTAFTVPTASSPYTGGGTCAQQFPGLNPGAEVGNIFRVIGGPGKGATAVVSDNDSTSFTLAGAGLSLGIDATSIWIIEEGSWTFTQPSGVISNSVPPTQDGVTLDPTVTLFSSSLTVNNWVGDTLLVMGVAVDVNGNEAPEATNPFREVYMIGAAGATFIRDWLAEGIIQGSLSVGTDVMDNYIVVRCNVGEYVQLSDTAIVAKTAPVGADAVIDVLVSHNNGSTWESIYNAPLHLPDGNSSADFDSTNLAVDQLYRNDLLRFDIIQVGSTTAGAQVSIDIKGKVFS